MVAAHPTARERYKREGVGEERDGGGRLFL